MRSGCAPIVSNGAAERFTQAVRIPAALAPALSNALLVTSRSCPIGRESRPAACRYTTGDGLNTRTSSTLIRWPKNSPRPLLSRQFLIMAAGPVGKHRELVPQAGQRPQGGDGVGERSQMVIELDEPLGLPVRQVCPDGDEGEVKRA